MTTKKTYLKQLEIEKERKKEKICGICGNIFHSPYKEQKYCDAVCRYAAHRDKAKKNIYFRKK